jgi:hypothetical protein
MEFSAFKKGTPASRRPFSQNIKIKGVSRIISRILYSLAVAVLLTACGASATSILDLSLDQQVARADTIVRGHVLSVESILIDGAPHTHVTVSVEETLKGSVGSSVAFDVLGGPYPDGRFLSVDGAPRFTVGQEVCLLLRGSSTSFPIVGLNRGLYEIDASGRVSDHAGRAVSGVGADGALARSEKRADALPWSSFRDRLRQSVQKQ